MLTHEWERATVARLLKLLRRSELQELLGSLSLMLRRVRSDQLGHGQRGTKLELAAALVLQHGHDLLADPRIRRHIARAARVKCPKAWHPGKPGAIQFVRAARFPSQLAGSRSTSRHPAYLFLEGPRKLPRLLDFQREAKNKLVNVMGSAGSRGILSMTTGSGKTRVAVEALRDAIDRRSGGADHKGLVLWVAHTEELCEQAFACIRDVWQNSPESHPLHLFPFWGKYTEDSAGNRKLLRDCLGQNSILVSTPQRLVNLLDRGQDPVLDAVKSSIGLIVVDEAHRGAAPTYLRILEELDSSDRQVSLVGLTATPFRGVSLHKDDDSGTEELKEIFHRLIEPTRSLGDSPRLRLQGMGVLAKPSFLSIPTRTVLRLPAGIYRGGELSGQQIEKIDRALARKADTADRRLAIAKHLLPIAGDRSNAILYFGPSVHDAECMAWLLKAMDVPAVFIGGKTRSETRRQIIDDFKRGKIRVLCNCDVLTTGFDAPRVSHLVMARPTVSRVLYEQTIGRALRGPMFGGTRTCLIMKCEDDFQGARPELGHELARRAWRRRG